MQHSPYQKTADQLDATIAVYGIDYDNSDSILQWKKSNLMCTLKDQRLIQLRMADNHQSFTKTHDFFINDYGRLPDVCIAPDGSVFVCTSNGSNDKLVVISKK